MHISCVVRSWLIRGWDIYSENELSTILTRFIERLLKGKETHVPKLKLLSLHCEDGSGIASSIMHDTDLQKRCYECGIRLVGDERYNEAISSSP